MLIYWEDLADALQELLGFSYRDFDTIPATLGRVLPWRHPFASQLFVKNIASVKGVQLAGIDTFVPEGSEGGGDYTNTGPWSDWTYALLTLHFWRPPYFVRGDGDILNISGDKQEWLRYVERNWSINTQMVSVREGIMEYFAYGSSPTPSNTFNFGVGTAIGRVKMTLTWYEIPERAIFGTWVDNTPMGIPANLIYARTGTTNPITALERDGGAGVSNTNADGSAKGSTILGCVNSPVGGGTTDSSAAVMFFGCPTGTLLYTGCELRPRALQMPQGLMLIPDFGKNEAISQRQYDVVLNFDFIDPPRAKYVVDNNANHRGHNLKYWHRDLQWYAVQTQGNVVGSSPAKPATCYHYADFTDLFKIM